MLLFCIGMVFLLASCDSESGSVTMEINPGVEYKITQKGNVSSVRFLNDDAKKALEEVSFKGQSLKTAVTFTIATYKTIGYMENNDMVLISFDKKLNENSKLKKSISDDIHQALAETKLVHTIVYASAEENNATSTLVKKYGISQGKAKLVEEATKNSNLTVEEVVTLPLDELVSLQKEVDSVIINSKYIGMLQAKKIALKDAGCVMRVEFTETRLIDNGNKYPHYRLVFNDKQTQWTYIINALNGDIVEKNKIVMFITLEEAKTIALKHAEINVDDSEEKVVFTKEELSRNQGRPCWILEFYTKKYQYSYKIDAKTGEIIYKTCYLYIERAKEIALQDSGIINLEKIVFTSKELIDFEVKKPYYYFEFNDSYIKWTYHINAINGEIIFKDKEPMILLDRE